MRGNPRFYGRNDCTEPAPMTLSEWLAVDAVSVALKPGAKTVFSVFQDDQEIGFVTTRLAGQYFKMRDTDGWLFVANEWNQNDPAHGRAILALIQSSVHPITSHSKALPCVPNKQANEFA